MPKIALVGRQNVGKSSLFNALLGRKESITLDQPGVTRDRVERDLPWAQGVWTLTDFPGFEKISRVNDTLEKESIEAALTELDQYNLLLWVVDRRGYTPFENYLLKEFQRKRYPFWMLLNFADDPSLDHSERVPSYSGIGRFFVSGLNRRGIKSLKSALLKHFSAAPLVDDFHDTETLKLAIIGKPNAGKSNLFNRLTNANTALVSGIPGTTRDPLQKKIQANQKSLLILDTAGLKRKDYRSQGVDFYSISRTKKKLDEADIAILVIDPAELDDRQNRRLMETLANLGKPAVILINKYDLLTDAEIDLAEERITAYQKQFWNFPYLFVSAETGYHCHKILPEVLRLMNTIPEAPSTPQLNQLLKKVTRNAILQSHNVKFNYVTMDKSKRKVLLFGNKKSVPTNIKKYLETSFRRELGWEEIPLKVEVRHKQKPKA